MKDTRPYFADGMAVFSRRGNSPVVNTEVARCHSNRLAKLVANCLNLYRRNWKFAASVDAAEKGESQNADTGHTA